MSSSIHCHSASEENDAKALLESIINDGFQTSRNLNLLRPKVAHASAHSMQKAVLGKQGKDEQAA
eukprot:1727787-Amphidinium_carterae.1